MRSSEGLTIKIQNLPESGKPDLDSTCMTHERLRKTTFDTDPGIFSMYCVCGIATFSLANARDPRKSI